MKFASRVGGAALVAGFFGGGMATNAVAAPLTLLAFSGTGSDNGAAIPRFNPSLGTLLEVRIVSTAVTGTTFALENAALSPQTGTVSLSLATGRTGDLGISIFVAGGSDVGLFPLGTNTLSVALPEAIPEPERFNPDAVSPGVGEGRIIVTATVLTSLLPTDGDLFGSFLLGGPNNPTLVAVGGGGFCTISGPPGVSGDCPDPLGADLGLTVSYVYSPAVQPPPPPVPAPAAAGLFALALLGLSVARRR